MVLWRKEGKDMQKVYFQTPTCHCESSYKMKGIKEAKPLPEKSRHSMLTRTDDSMRWCQNVDGEVARTHTHTGQIGTGDLP